MRTLIIGRGEIGKSLEKVLKGALYTVFSRDKENIPDVKNVEIMHICFPYSDTFIETVKDYQEEYQPKYTVIHSTVPVGTSRKCNAIHSPVVGIHPHLADSIKTFTKYLSGEGASEVADYFRRAGIKVYLFNNQEETELMKRLEDIVLLSKEIEKKLGGEQKELKTSEVRVITLSKSVEEIEQNILKKKR